MEVTIVIWAQRVSNRLMKIKVWFLKINLQETPWNGTYTFTAIITLGDRKWSSVTLKWVGNKKKILQNVWLMWLSTKLPSLLLQGNSSRGINNFLGVLQTIQIQCWHIYNSMFGAGYKLEKWQKNPWFKPWFNILLHTQSIVYATV